MKKYKLLKDLPKYKAGTEFRLTKKGHLATGNTMVYHKNDLERFPNILDEWFEEILEQPKTVWDLKDGDECWTRTAMSSCLSAITPVVATRETWHGDVHHLSLREIGGVFLTEEDCEKDMTWQKAKQILLRDTKGFKPNWRDNDQIKYIVYFNHADNSLRTDHWASYHSSSMHFATEEDAIASIKAHEKEWKTYLGAEE